MTDFATTPITSALNRLIQDLESLADDGVDLADPLKFERSARAISACLKSLGAVEDYNQQAAKIQKEEKYTRYEDLPPPSPEEQDRFYARLESVIGKIEAGETLPDPRRLSETDLGL